jgi:crossover junction endodeoxyribonuclease RusA
VISFFVGGQPISQGSMKVMNGRVIHSAGSALAAWRSAIALEAKRAGAKPSINAIGMELIFVFQKPKTVTRSQPSVPPDLDKLIRAALDALTAIAYRDDAQVTEIRAQKCYGDYPGVQITYSEIK